MNTKTVLVLAKKMIDGMKGLYLIEPKRVNTIDHNNKLSSLNDIDKRTELIFGFITKESELSDIFKDTEYQIDEVNDLYYNAVTKYLDMGITLDKDKFICVDKEKLEEYEMLIDDAFKSSNENFEIKIDSGVDNIRFNINDEDLAYYIIENYKNLSKFDCDIEPLARLNDEAINYIQEKRMKQYNTERMDINQIKLIDKLRPQLNELDKLVGLENVKDEIYKLINYIIYRERTKEYLEFNDLNLNMVFTGNPGTGKTTVAGILSKMLYDLGYLKSNKVEYVTAEKLIAGFVGQTAIKTRKLLDQNKGGVIVVDEAYVLANEANKFAPEAVAEILKDMEKKETAFIFAGYEREMKDFISMNSGISSRIGIKVNFQNYTVEELYQMLVNNINRMCLTDKKLTLTPEAQVKVITLIEQAIKRRDFGNARYINNLTEEILRNKANTISDCLTIDDLLKIDETNIPNVIIAPVEKEKVKTIGFAAK